MKENPWSTVSKILVECLEMDTRERLEYLKGLDIEASVKEEVEALLKLEPGAQRLMDVSAVEMSYGIFPVEDTDEASAGKEFGPYRVIRELGYGGMGAVYLAERADGEFSQLVALKVLKHGLDTAAFRSRFAQEREINASLNHPNIARLLDAGTSSDNVPYIALEYIEGVPITEYCATHELDKEARLELFRKVCRAVEIAHRNLIVHRDLKPSNILVTADGTPQLLDFGISKILSEDLEAVDAATVTKMGLMTPSYASPEQLQSRSVTTAADVYSLGVILFELLSGHRPFEEKEGDLSAIYKAVAEQDPPPPSAMALKPRPLEPHAEGWHLSTDGPHDHARTAPTRTPATLSGTFSVDPQSIRGDLDNIVLKALRKEPERRYTSVENLSEDIRRHLVGLPVSARPNTLSYRAEKFVKRNKVVVVAGALLVAAIAAGVAATIWQARIAQAESARALQAAARAEKTNAYLQKVLNFSNPGWLSSNPEQNRNATVADALDEAVRNLETDLAGSPEVYAEVANTLGQTYVGQGQYDKAANLLRLAIEKFREVDGPGGLREMQTTVILADTMYFLGKPAEAEGLYNQAIAYFRPVVARDPSQAKWLAIALTDLGNVHSLNGDFEAAEAVNRESLVHGESLAGKDRFMIPIVYTNLGMILGRKGDTEGAIKQLESALAEFRQLGNDRKFEGGTPLYHLGILLNTQGRYDEAEERLREAREIFVATVGADNAYTSSVMYHQANGKFQQGKHAEAEKLINTTIELQERIFPKGHFLLDYSKGLLGRIYTVTGRISQGEARLREAEKHLAENVKPTSRELSDVRASLAKNLVEQKKYAEAESFLNQSLSVSVGLLGPDHPENVERRELLDRIENGLRQ
ncbi:MAG: tetratricopeptide repeat protein [Pyrinomonadaceae bacterium]